MSAGILDCGRSLCKGHASEWGIIKSQHRRGPPTAWPLGKEQEQTRLNERRSFSRYRPAYKLADIFYLQRRYQGLCGRTRTNLSISENSSRGSIDGLSHGHNFISRRARRNLNASTRTCRRWNHNALNHENISFCNFMSMVLLIFFLTFKQRN